MLMVMTVVIRGFVAPADVAAIADTAHNAATTHKPRPAAEILIVTKRRVDHPRLRRPTERKRLARAAVAGQVRSFVCMRNLSIDRGSPESARVSRSEERRVGKGCRCRVR